MQLLIDERYPPHTNCHVVENLPYLFENRCHITLEGGETPIAYFSVSLQFDQCFAVILQPQILIKFNSTILRVLVGQREK